MPFLTEGYRAARLPVFDCRKSHNFPYLRYRQCWRNREEDRIRGGVGHGNDTRQRLHIVRAHRRFRHQDARCRTIVQGAGVGDSYRAGLSVEGGLQLRNAGEVDARILLVNGNGRGC